MTRTRITNAYVQSLQPRLTQRDLDIVDTTEKLRLVRATQLERLFFAQLAVSSRARRRRDVLARLTSLGLLAALQRRIGGVRAGSAGLIYSLGPAGQRLQQLRHRASGARLRRLAEPSAAFRDHTLAIAETFTLLHETPLEVLRIETEPAAWRPFNSGLSVEVLKPDLFVEVADAGLVYDWFIEVDLGTERGPALARKAARYLAAYRHGLTTNSETFPRVLWIAPNEGRADFVQDALDGVGGPAELFRVAAVTDDLAQLARLLVGHGGPDGD